MCKIKVMYNKNRPKYNMQKQACVKSLRHARDRGKKDKKGVDKGEKVW